MDFVELGVDLWLERINDTAIEDIDGRPILLANGDPEIVRFVDHRRRKIVEFFVDANVGGVLRPRP